MGLVVLSSAYSKLSELWACWRLALAMNFEVLYYVYLYQQYVMFFGAQFSYVLLQIADPTHGKDLQSVA
jgi:hypothetical protein